MDRQSATEASSVTFVPNLIPSRVLRLPQVPVVICAMLHQIDENKWKGGGNHFGLALAKVTPFSMLPLSPSRALARSFFSFSVMSPRISMAFSAPLGWIRSVSGPFDWIYSHSRRARLGRRRSRRQSSWRFPHHPEHRAGKHSWARRGPWHQRRPSTASRRIFLLTSV